MKHAKKLASLLLAMVLVLGLATTAFAAQEGTLTGGSITINDAVPEQIYKAYQLLYIESYSDVSSTEKDELGNPTGGNYAYKANSTWETWLRTQTSYVSFDAQGYVTWVEGADAAAFAKLAQVEAAKMTADATATAPAAAEGATYSTVKFEGLKLGYYLVDTTLGTLCSLDTTNPNVVMEEKNEVPANVKTVEEDSTGIYGETNDADIGQTVNFKSTITAQAGAENYVFHDTMSTGLTYTGVTGVTLNNVDVDTSYYSVVTEGLTDGCTFEVRFTQTFCDTLKANDQIVISYTATLNEGAVVGLPGNPNTSSLSYGEKNSETHEPSGTTPPSTTTTYTWDLDILKYGNGDKAKVLADAKFVLLNKDKTKVATVVNGKITGWVASGITFDKNGEEITKTNYPSTWPNNTVLTTNASGRIEIDGLDSDTYYLHEEEAPAGYNVLAGDVEVVITGATTVDSTLAYTTVVAEVNNQSGTELPSTGGMGTTIFYILGGILVVGAVVLLVTKKRMSAEK